MKKIAIIGAGVMGLTCGYELAKKGYQVKIYEKDNQIGGMAASFDFKGVKIDKYYHFICGDDQDLFRMLKDLEIHDLLKWEKSNMGFLFEGKVHKWGDPASLLLFPEANFFYKLAYGLHIFFASKINNWEKLDLIGAKKWIIKYIGKKGYDIFWKYLLKFKFNEFEDQVSAAWIWARIKRLIKSRENVFTEKLGYLEGSTDVLLQKLADHILKNGGKIEVGSEIQKVTVKDQKVQGVLVNNKEQLFDAVISTVPIPLIEKIIPDLPKTALDKYSQIPNLTIICPTFILKHKITDYFWLNIHDSTIDSPGIIEFSNLNRLEHKIVYLPFYLSVSNKDIRLSDEGFFERSISLFKKLNKNFNKDWILDFKVHRYQYAQPVCTTNFLKKIPAIKTEIDNLLVADTSYFYPEDRTISESIKLGLKLSRMSDRADEY